MGKSKIVSLINNYIHNTHPSKAFLETKWWHRLLKILYYCLTAIIAVATILGMYYEWDKTLPNVQVISNLETFTKNSNPSIVDTVPSFLKLEGELGCLNTEAGRVDYLYESGFLEKSVCSADIEKNSYEIAKLIAKKNLDYSDINLIDLHQQVLKNIKQEKRICYIHQDADCNSTNAIKYKRSGLFYSKSLIYSSLIIIGWIAISWHLYFKVILYIAYGKKTK